MLIELQLYISNMVMNVVSIKFYQWQAAPPLRTINENRDLDILLRKLKGIFLSKNIFMHIILYMRWRLVVWIGNVHISLYLWHEGQICYVISENYNLLHVPETVVPI
ncbi:hypothetical protein ACJX0J_019797 [Zea mays]